MKQKMVVKVHMRCDKCRTKAMKIAANESGVSSVQIDGENKDQVVVIGEEVDPVSLTRSLRKKVGHAIILRVEEEKEPKKGADPNDQSISSRYIIQYPQPPLVYYEMVHDPSPPYCSIL